ncbi:MAG: Rrf2 family transcriptional regulator [Acidobacteriota bacterium]|nr:MAG: Rrf2 family transcriptional regulator [Acidobacteriota bacterium]
MLSATTGYALRTLVCLARASEGVSLPGRQIAELTAVPANYLSKMLLVLRNSGLVTASRGIHGGYQLRPEVLNLPLIRIVEIFEGPRSRPACVLNQDSPCSDDSPCPAHRAWSAVRDAYTQFLEKTTLADISQTPLRMTRPLKEVFDPGEQK